MNVVKEIIREGGRERIRIFKRANQTFGVVHQNRPEDTEAWFPDLGLVSGAAYASVEIAEREAAVVFAWLRIQKAPNKAPEPTPTSVTPPANESKTK